jgi:hypothetical protein
LCTVASQKLLLRTRKYLPVVNIHNNKMLRGTTARPPGRFNYDRQAPDKVGYFNYGPGKLLPQGLPLGRKLSQFFGRDKPQRGLKN